MIGIYVHKLSPKAELPSRETDFSACFDVKACFHADEVKVNGIQKIKPVDHGTGRQVTLFVGDRMLVPTGLICIIPEYYKIAVYPRSGLAFVQGVTVINSPGTVDGDYNRELFVLLTNQSDVPVVIKEGDRIAQIEFMPVVTGKVVFEEVDFDHVLHIRKLTEERSTKARTGGIGHTGK